ncbi:PREDICTED: F-box/kelch-repeat protein At3g23880-like isoform X2 [Ipomoea nil]|uniref:F-box/kelch-repeat protein At3g23880-like isoform X2 n=1 Tax=Ipomoea nil TaxID=35883 RepID=UPI000900A1B0|nr:PREDICTED: F-box/kelch-repeat protein At3g23880-like isoform X2 [Ipomoea nil]
MASGEQRLGQLAQQTSTLSLHESPSPLANLPQEIIAEVLARLPVECLLRFRCVSKSWLALISTHHFVNTHLHVCKNKHESSRNRLFLIASFSGLGKICSISSIVPENSSPTLVELSRFSKSPCRSPRILGSCNGLLCLSTVHFKLILWNPSTRKSREFPDSFIQTKSGCYIRYGFGYDERTNDYKVVKMFSFEKNGGRHENIVKAYSLRANSWTMMSGFSSAYIYGKCGVFLNGAIHWEIRDTDSWDIVALDLGTERYRTMALPRAENGKFYWTLGVSRGCLLACCFYYPKRTHLWVMKEYGVAESWTKVVSFTLSDHHRGYITVLHMSENGEEVLLKLGTQLAVYNSRNGSFKHVECVASPRTIEVQSATYDESLALLDIGHDSQI